MREYFRIEQIYLWLWDRSEMVDGVREALAKHTTIREYFNTSCRTLERDIQQMQNLGLVRVLRHREYSTFVLFVDLNSPKLRIANSMYDNKLQSLPPQMAADLTQHKNLTQFNSLSDNELASLPPNLSIVVKNLYTLYTLYNNVLPSIHDNTCNTLYTCNNVNNEETMYMTKSTQLPLGFPRSPDEPPTVPFRASELVKETHSLPYPKTNLQTSVVVYWALQRYTRHQLEYVMTKSSFRQFAIQFARHIVPTLGKSWKAAKDYIDWYLSNVEKFVVVDCAYGFEYLTSTRCLNKYMASRKRMSDIIFTEEERNRVGRWIKD